LTPNEHNLSLTDYNLIHTKWRIEYYIVDSLAFVENLWDGTKPDWRSVNHLLKLVLSDAVILVSANRDIDWIIWENPKQFRYDVELVMMSRLDDLQVGLKANLVLIDKTTPRQVKGAFDKATAARSAKNALLKTASAQASEIVNEADAQEKIIIARAKAYQEKIVKAAQADEAYLNEVLDKIKNKAQEKFPETVSDYQAKRKLLFDRLLSETVDQLYQEMLREVVVQSDETIVLPTAGDKSLESRIHISRDASLAPRQANKPEENIK